jgi:hypothetical protein
MDNENVVIKLSNINKAFKIKERRRIDYMHFLHNETIRKVNNNRLNYKYSR